MYENLSISNDTSHGILNVIDVPISVSPRYLVITNIFKINRAPIIIRLFADIEPFSNRKYKRGTSKSRNIVKTVTRSTTCRILVQDQRRTTFPAKCKLRAVRQGMESDEMERREPVYKRFIGLDLEGGSVDWTAPRRRGTAPENYRFGSIAEKW